MIVENRQHSRAFRSKPLPFENERAHNDDLECWTPRCPSTLGVPEEWGRPGFDMGREAEQGIPRTRVPRKSIWKRDSRQRRKLLPSRLIG